MEHFLCSVPCSGPQAAVEPVALALRHWHRKGAGSHGDCLHFSREEGTQEGWRQALCRARAACMLCHPWSCPTVAILCPRQSKVGCQSPAPHSWADLPECTFPAAGDPWSGLCSVWLFLVNMSLTKNYSLYILDLGINFIPTPVSSRCHHMTSVRASLEYK